MTPNPGGDDVTDREQLLAAYKRAWGHRDEPDIRAELERCWTSASTYVSPLTDVVRGVDGMLGLILDFPVMFPGARVEHTSPPDLHHDAAYFTWRLTSSTRIRMLGQDYGRSVEGVDFVEFDPDGAIGRITAFFGVDRHMGQSVAEPDLNGSKRPPLRRHEQVLDLTEPAWQTHVG